MGKGVGRMTDTVKFNIFVLRKIAKVELSINMQFFTTPFSFSFEKYTIAHTTFFSFERMVLLALNTSGGGGGLALLMAHSFSIGSMAYYEFPALGAEHNETQPLSG